MNTLWVLLAGEGGAVEREVGRQEEETHAKCPRVTLKMAGGSGSWQEDQKSPGAWTSRKLQRNCYPEHVIHSLHSEVGLGQRLQDGGAPTIT